MDEKENVESFRDTTETRLNQLEKAVKELLQEKVPPSTEGGTS